MTDHGHRGHDGRERSATYNSWRAMRERCTRPSHPYFEHYGGRGIKVCDRWAKFANFLADMGERPDGMTLDRRDVDGDYEPSNCRWATKIEQRWNRRDMAMMAEQRELPIVDVAGTPAEGMPF